MGGGGKSEENYHEENNYCLTRLVPLERPATSGKTGITSSGGSGWAASTVKEVSTVCSKI